MLTFRNTVCSIFIGRLNKKTYEDITECSEMSAQEILDAGESARNKEYNEIQTVGVGKREN